MKHEISLRTTPVSRLFRTFFLSTVIGLMAESLYVMIDGIIVCRGVGADALGAVNLALPFYNLPLIIGMLIGTGGSVVAGINLGEGAKKKAGEVFSLSMTLVSALTILLCLVCTIFLDDLTGILGASERLAPLVHTYLAVLLPFLPFFAVSHSLSCFVRNDGAPRLAMWMSFAPAILNCFLDALFVFAFKWGIGGAALATGLGWVLSIGIGSLHFLNRSRNLHLERLRPRISVLARIIRAGLPVSLAEAAMGIMILAFNIVVMRTGGEVAVSAYGVINILGCQAIMIFFGVTHAIQPLVSFAFGARRPDRMRDTMKLAIIVSLLLGATFALAPLPLGRWLVGLFAKDNTMLLDTALRGLRIYSTGFLFAGVNMVIYTYFQAVERPIPSITVMLMRGVVFVVAGLLTLPHLFGLTGAWMAVPLAELLTFVPATGYLYEKLFRERSIKAF